LQRFAGSNDIAAAAAHYASAPNAGPPSADSYLGDTNPDGSRRMAGDRAIAIEEQRREKELDRFSRLQDEES